MQHRFAFLIVVASSMTLNAQDSGLVTVLDVAKVFDKHPVFRAKMDALKEEVTQFQKSVREQVTALGQKRQQLTQAYKIGSPEFKAEEESLAQQEANLKIKTQQTERDYMNKEASLYYETYLEVQGIVAEFAKSNNIALVLRFDSSEIDQSNRASVSAGVNRFIVYQKQLDLTNLIIGEVEKKNAQANIQNGTPR